MNNTAPFTLSVVIPLYNKEVAVEATLQSVVSQTRLPDELIVIDDGSTDDSPAIVERFVEAAQSRLPVRVIRQENQGVAAARNRGAGEAKSRYIAFLDADDEWLPECVAEFQKLAESFPDATVFTARLAKVRNGALVPEPSALGPDYFGELASPLDAYRRGYGIMHASAVAVRRDAWDRSGGFPVGAQCGEDICWWVKLLTRERMAHSGRALSIWHDEFTGAAARHGTVPHHFAYYLGTSEGRKYLSNPAVVRFLASNLAVQIGGRRLARDPQVVRELRRLSAALPLRERTRPWGALLAPQWLLRKAIGWRRRGLDRARHPLAASNGVG